MALTKIVVNCETGVTEEIELNADEIAQIETDRAAYELQKAAELAEQELLTALKTSARAKLVAGEPLTTEEASLLIG